MPMFHLKVNVPGGSHHGVVKDADAFVKQLSKLLAETSTKPESVELQSPCKRSPNATHIQDNLTCVLKILNSNQHKGQYITGIAV